MRLNVIRSGPVTASRSMHYQYHWSTIFSGAFLTAGIGTFLLIFGNAVGLNISNVVDPAVGGALKFFSWVYMLLAAITSYFVGSYLSNRTDSMDAQTGMIHGMISWALATVIVTGLGALASVGVRNVLLGVGSNSANWLTVISIGFGFFAAASGGAAGKASLTGGQPVETTEEIRPSGTIGERASA